MNITFLPGPIPNPNRSLVVMNMSDIVVCEVPPPPSGWTRDALYDAAEKLPISSIDGANLFLGDDFVGTTEY